MGRISISPSLPGTLRNYLPNLHRRNLWQKAIALYLPKPTSHGVIRSMVWVIIRVLSQTMIVPSASNLIMPQHTTVAGLRRACSVNTLPPSQTMIPPSASSLIMPGHTCNRGVAKAQLDRISEAKRDGRTALRLAKQAGDTSLITRAEKLLRLLEGRN